jgi:signal transduction histidine kinase
VKVSFDWQKKTIVIFAVAISLLSILLTIFAIRAAKREQLIMELEIEEEQRRLADLILGQVRTIISDLEARIDRILRSYKAQPQEMELAGVCRRIMEGEEIISEIFLTNEEEEKTFPLVKPLFYLIEERWGVGQLPADLKSDPLWDRAERSEFGTEDYTAAIEYYKELMDATTIYRGTLVNRIGRCYKKSGAYSDAVKAYQEILEDYANEMSFDGVPLAIIAQYQTGDIYLATDRCIEGVEILLDLYDGLLKSKWLLSRSQFHFYLKKARDMLETWIPDVSHLEGGKRLTERWDGLRQLEVERSGRMNTIDNLRQKIIPLTGAKDYDYSEENSGIFHHVSDIIGGEPYLISYTLVDDRALGVLIDADAIATKSLPSILSMIPSRKGWHVQVTDESRNRLAGDDITHLGEPIPQLTFSKGFDDGFPPWRVDVYQSDPGSLRRLFRLRRNVYIISVAMVILAIIFAGYWAIRSTAKELKLASLKSDFVSTVSHELRTPLTSIRYLAELLQRGRVDNEERKQEYYETIANESEQLSRLINNILDFSRIEAGMKEYQFSDTDMAELARDVASKFQQQAAQAGFTVKSQVSDQIPEASVDREAISQALFNLLDNALKYSGESREIFLSAWSDKDSVFLQIRDEGTGIREEEKEKVFEKFYRSEYLRDNSIRGSGIGLTLVAHIVKAHGGQVLLESNPGKGTKVVIELPVKRKVVKNGQNSNSRG